MLFEEHAALDTWLTEDALAVATSAEEELDADWALSGRTLRHARLVSPAPARRRLRSA